MVNLGRKVVCIKDGMIYWTIGSGCCVKGEIYHFTNQINNNGYIYDKNGKFLGVSNKCNFMYLDEYRDKRINDILDDC